MSDLSVGSLGSTNNEFQSQALQNLDKDAFLQLLVAQMRYQNPLSPVDSNEYLAQAAQYASVEQLENMAQSQAELRSMQMVSIATDLVGKQVTAVNSFSGEVLTGTVEGIRFGVEPMLIVDGFEVPLSSVISVGDVDGPEPAPEDSNVAPEPAPEPNDTSSLDPPIGGGAEIPSPGDGDGPDGAAVDPPQPTDPDTSTPPDPDGPVAADPDGDGGGSASSLDPPVTASSRAI